MPPQLRSGGLQRRVTNDCGWVQENQASSGHFDPYSLRGSAKQKEGWTWPAGTWEREEDTKPSTLKLLGTFGER